MEEEQKHKVDQEFNKINLDLLNNININPQTFDCNKYKNIPIFGKALSEKCNNSIQKCDDGFKDIPYIGTFLVGLCKLVTSSTNEYEYNSINDVVKPVLYISSSVLCVIFIAICVLYMIVLYILYNK